MGRMAVALAIWGLAVGGAGAQEDAMSGSLTGTPGDVARGRAIVANRQVGLCLLCHNAIWRLI